MTLKRLLAILGLAFLTFGCTDTQHYPVSGEECTEQDPVHELTAQQCVQPS